MISIHALREEGDRVRVAGEFPRQEFLSTPSARRATLSNRLWLGRLFISIHALREEGDAYEPFHLREKIEISIHALREEGDQQAAPVVSTADKFLSTPSARRATIPSRQGLQGQGISIHALREEGDKGRRSRITGQKDFYPRPPRGGRRDAQGAVDLDAVFLSTPSARRATVGEAGADHLGHISIHALREEGDSAASISI